jgi:hypothetical protein
MHGRRFMLRPKIWKSVRLEGDHGSMVGRSIYDGPLDVFADWQVPQGLLLEGDVPRIEKPSSASWESGERSLNAVGSPRARWRSWKLPHLPTARARFSHQRLAALMPLLQSVILPIFNVQ